jgi:hypothetical protein
MKRLIMLCGVLFLAQLALADTTDVILGTQQNGNTIPFWGNGYTAHRFQTVFLQSEINLAGQIIKFAVMPQTISNPTYNNLRLYLCHSTRTNDLSTTFNDNYTGNTPQLMFDSASCTFNVNANEWLEFPANFEYDNVNNLLAEIRWRGSSNQNTYIWRCGTSGSGTFRVFFLGSDSAATGSADYVRYYVKLTIVTATGVEEVLVGDKTTASNLMVQPNPVRTGREMRIAYSDLPEDPVTELQMYELNGRLVRCLALGRAMTAVWDLKDQQGNYVPAGVYFIRAGRHTARVVVVD